MQLATAAATWCNAYDVGFEDLFLAKRSAADWAMVMQRARTTGARNFTFATSGSTGKRQQIRHREDTLMGEAQAWAGVLQAGPTPVTRVVMLAPTHHIYGFIWGVLLPHVLQVPVLDADLTDLPTLHTGDLIVAVPDQWAWLAEAFQRKSAEGASKAVKACKAFLQQRSPDAHTALPPGVGHSWSHPT
jgi:4-coumarate--CoA ligase